MAISPTAKNGNHSKVSGSGHEKPANPIKSLKFVFNRVVEKFTNHEGKLRSAFTRTPSEPSRGSQPLQETDYKRFSNEGKSQSAFTRTPSEPSRGSQPLQETDYKRFSTDYKRFSDDNSLMIPEQLSKKKPNIQDIADQLINLSKENLEKGLEALKDHWNSFFISEPNSDLLKKKQTPHSWLLHSRFYPLLAIISTNDQGISLVCTYIKKSNGAEENKKYIDTTVDFIYKIHAENQTFLEKLPIFTKADLEGETPETLLRNTTLTSKLCQRFLNDTLGPSLTELMNSFLDCLKKNPLQVSALFDDFLNQFYAMKIPEEVKIIIQIRCQVVLKHFASLEEVASLAQDGINQLLFLTFINPFFLGLSDNNASVVTLTKIIQRLANQTPFQETSKESEYNPLYEKFKTTHQQFIEKLYI